MAVQERVAEKEVLSPAELGEKAHGEIIRIIDGLRATPESNAAIFNRFFDRSFRHGDPLTPSNYGVIFDKGDYRYNVSYSSEPLRYRDGGPNTPANARMDILKFDTRIMDADNHLTRVARVHLSTRFDEDVEKTPTEFKDGGVIFEDEAGKQKDTPDVFDKIANALAELTPQTKI